MARLVRYQVLAATRRHFEVLFFAVIASSWSFALAFAAALQCAWPGSPVVTLSSAGAILLCGTFVAHRLLRRERSAFHAMNDCWSALSSDQACPASLPRRTLGAMEMVVGGQFVVVAVLITFAAISL